VAPPDPSRGGAGPLVAVGDGVSLRTSHPMDLLALLEVYVLDVYDGRRLRPGSVVVDLGAGVGDFAVFASKRVGPDGLVLALEPSPVDFPVLVENLQRNGCGNVRPRNAVLAAGGGTISLRFKDEGFDAATVSLPELLRGAGLSLDALRGRPVALKLDIEGGELAALTELLPLLPSVATVAIELHGTQPEVDALLAPNGFAFHRLGRGTYLLRSLRFLLRHPVTGVRLWRRYRRSPRYSGVSKIVRGIDIAASPGLRVGVYRRPAQGAR
jgi:FkbM family methyltransferase